MTGWSRCRVWLGLVAVCAFTGCAAEPPVVIEERPIEPAADLETRAREIHERVLTIDTHDDIPLNFATGEVDPGVRGARQVDLPKMEAGGLDAGFFVVYVAQTERTPENYARARADAITKFEAIHRMTDELYPERIGLARAADDFARIAESGRLVAAIGVENGYVIGQDLSLVETYYDLGARYFGLVHNGHNDIADSANPRPELSDRPSEHGGLSAFGEEVVRELNRLGIMVDVSHASRAAMLEVTRLSQAPVIASHSSVRALVDHPRNLDDEQLRALADNDGVMQTVALDAFVSEATEARDDAISALRESVGLIPRDDGGLDALSSGDRARFEQELREIGRIFQRADVAAFVDHIDYAVQLIGLDHVGISSDFDGGGGVEGWDDASESFNVTLELVRRGYSEAEIARLWGGNLLRALRRVEEVAASWP